MNSIDKLIAIAENEVGYLEKKSNNQLDDKIANAGYNNYTKYARDLVKWIGSPYVQAQPYCDMFCDWCFVVAFGKETAKKLLGGWSAYTPTSANFYVQMGRWHTTNPKRGDQIFFHNSQRICHTGLVYAVDNNYVYTIEGNTSAGNGVIANGGGVAKKKYPLNYKSITGYGRPDYSIVDSANISTPTPASTKNNVTYSNPYPVPSSTVRMGSKGNWVKWVQYQLNGIGKYGLVIDGDFGNNTKNAVLDFQRKNGLEVDAIVGPDTRKTLSDVGKRVEI